MINISNNHPVSWPQASAPVVAPVSAVSAVKPVQDGRGDGQAGLGGGRGGAATPAQRREAARNAGSEPPAGPEAAPLLPREANKGSADAPSDMALKREQAEAKKAEQAERAQKAEEQSKKLQLQEVLTSVWQASAAVVDRVLARSSAGEADAVGNQSDTSPSLGVASAMLTPRKVVAPEQPALPPVEPLPWPVMPEDSSAAQAPVIDVDPRPVQEVVAYDEHGNSSLAPLEAGSLVSERV